MKHRIKDYTDRDLAAAVKSPYNSKQRQVELEMEINRRG